MINLFFLLLMTVSLYGKTLEVKSGNDSYKEAPEFQAILSNLKLFGEFEKKQTNEVKPKPMTRGEQMVEEAKARNRAILAERNKQEKASAVTNPTQSELEKWKAEEKKTLNEWKKETKEQLNLWKREQEIFLGRLKIYQENTFSMPVKTEHIEEKVIPSESIPDLHIVSGAFKVPIRDQEARPTCVAFAGVRAIETILVQNNLELDLSEQYLYWASKPTCQKVACSQKGSWITPGYQYSKNRPVVDIPVESHCSYRTQSVPANETQIPLSETCHEGQVKVSTFSELKTISEVVEKIKQDTPVIIAAKLSENFYKNKGLITLSESYKTSGRKLDSHSMGHAFLAVGLIELPQKLKSSEGNFCLVVANSWGKGWGAGGYSCITEKWFEKYRQKSPFVSVTSVTIK